MKVQEKFNYNDALNLLIEAKKKFVENYPKRVEEGAEVVIFDLKKQTLRKKLPSNFNPNEVCKFEILHYFKPTIKEAKVYYKPKERVFDLLNGLEILV